MCLRFRRFRINFDVFYIYGLEGQVFLSEQQPSSIYTVGH